MKDYDFHGNSKTFYESTADTLKMLPKSVSFLSLTLKKHFAPHQPFFESFAFNALRLTRGALHYAKWIIRMIKSFKCKKTEDLSATGESWKFKNIELVALRKLDMLEAVVKLDSLRIPPGNHFEALHGDRAGQYSIRINKKWRICFTWHDGNVYNVEIVDYH